VKQRIYTFYDLRIKEFSTLAPITGGGAPWGDDTAPGVWEGASFSMLWMASLSAQGRMVVHRWHCPYLKFIYGWQSLSCMCIYDVEVNHKDPELQARFEAYLKSQP